MGERPRRAKRSYVRLAAHLAAQPREIQHLVLSFQEIEELLGQELPPHAAFPFWWNNHGLTAHSTAWLSSGWQVSNADTRARRVEFGRRQAPGT